MNITLTEEWRPVPIAGLGDFYEVSSLGRVRSVDRICHGVKRPRRCDGKILKHRVNKVGYPQISMWRYGQGKTVNVHRLVAIAFIPNPTNLPMVNHIDGVKTNSAAANLEWTNDTLNKQHAINVGIITRFKKLLTPEEVAEIRSLN